MKVHFAFVLSASSALAVVSGLGCAGRVIDDTGSLAATSGGSKGDGSPASTTSASCASRVGEGGSSPAANGRVPVSHRASSCCSSQRGPAPETQPYPAGIAATGPDGRVMCSSDSDCRSGSNGRCFPFEGLVGPGGCSYDECSNDSDCPSASLCVCRSSATDNSANACGPRGNCAVDSDCGPGGFCSPSKDVCYGPSPFYCHTALDTCTDDADCPVVDGGYPNIATCAFDQQARHWTCRELVCYLP